MKTCRERNDHGLVANSTVLGRLEYLRDFHAADAVYHQTCSINFRTGKNIPKQCSADLDNDAKRCKTQGRPVDTVKSSTFLEVVQYLLENLEEQITVADLTEKMEGTEEHSYSVVYMKRRLQEHFGHRIAITSTKKRPNVVIFKHTVASIVQPRCDDLKFLEALCELGFPRWFSPFFQDESRTLFNCCENHYKKILFVFSEPLLEYGTIQKSSGKNLLNCNLPAHSKQKVKQ